MHPDHETFDAFEDMIPEGAVAIQGIRLVTLLDESGRQWVQWSYAGNPSIDEVVAMLSRLTFLAQMSEYIVTTQDGASDGDDPS